MLDVLPAKVRVVRVSDVGIEPAASAVWTLEDLLKADRSFYEKVSVFVVLVFVAATTLRLVSCPQHTRGSEYYEKASKL